MSTSLNILVIEDEEPLRIALVDALEAKGHRVSEAADGEQGLALALAEGPDIVLLDLMLPGRDGFSVLRELRRDRLAALVVILSARGEEWDRIQGFEYGADDYMVKPFSVRELMLRLDALGRRANGDVPGARDPVGRVRIGETLVDMAGYTAERNGERIGLSRRELELLEYFLRNEGQVVDRNAILNAVWGHDADPTPRTVDMHVLKLRKKLELEPDQPRHFITVRGVGYRFERR